MTTSNALNYYRDLIKAGIPEQQAYSQTTALERAIEHLATKEDLISLHDKLDAKIDGVDGKIGIMQKWEIAMLVLILGSVLKVAFFR